MKNYAFLNPSFLPLSDFVTYKPLTEETASDPFRRAEWVEDTDVYLCHLEDLLTLDDAGFWSQFAVAAKSTLKMLDSFLHYCPRITDKDLADLNFFNEDETIQELTSDVFKNVLLVFMRLADYEKSSVYGVTCEAQVTQLLNQVMTRPPSDRQAWKKTGGIVLEILSKVESEVSLIGSRKGSTPAEILEKLREITAFLVDVMHTLTVTLELCPQASEALIGVDFLERIPTFYESTLTKLRQETSLISLSSNTAHARHLAGSAVYVMQTIINIFRTLAVDGKCAPAFGRGKMGQKRDEKMGQKRGKKGAISQAEVMEAFEFYYDLLANCHSAQFMLAYTTQYPLADDAQLLEGQGIDGESLALIYQPYQGDHLSNGDASAFGLPTSDFQPSSSTLKNDLIGTDAVLEKSISNNAQEGAAKNAVQIDSIATHQNSHPKAAAQNGPLAIPGAQKGQRSNTGAQKGQRSNTSATTGNSVADVELESMVTSIQEMLEGMHLSAEFVRLVLATALTLYFQSALLAKGRSAENVIDAILSGELDPEQPILNSGDGNSGNVLIEDSGDSFAQTSSASTRRPLSDSEEDEEYVKLKTGKKRATRKERLPADDDKERTRIFMQRMMEDEIKEKARLLGEDWTETVIVSALADPMLYEDERDDTYDTVNVGAKDADEIEEILPYGPIPGPSDSATDSGAFPSGPQPPGPPSAVPRTRGPKRTPKLNPPVVGSNKSDNLKDLTILSQAQRRKIDETRAKEEIERKKREAKQAQRAAQIPRNVQRRDGPPNVGDVNLNLGGQNPNSGDSGQGQSGGQGSRTSNNSSKTEYTGGHSRQYKDRNRAKIAHHNRKEMAARKAAKGMMG